MGNTFGLNGLSIGSILHVPLAGELAAMGLP